MGVSRFPFTEDMAVPFIAGVPALVFASDFILALRLAAALWAVVAFLGVLALEAEEMVFLFCFFSFTATSLGHLGFHAGLGFSPLT